MGRDVAGCAWVGGFVPGAADFVLGGWFWVADEKSSKSMFLTIFGSKIELVPLSNRKIDVFDDFRVKNRVRTSFEP